MIGSGLKKLAKANGMTVSNGVAYGSLMGYATTLSEGSGFKRMDIVTRFPEVGQQERFQAAVNGVNVTREYRVQQLNLGANVITVIFQDTVGTMKKLEAFVDWFYPLLAQHGATRYNVCPECGTEAPQGNWYLIDGVAWRFHESCGQRALEQMAASDEQRRQEDTGSYMSGAVGAFLGAALGAVIWALVLMGGYVASLVGLLIGFLAEKGYNLLKGRQGKGKVIILILAIVFGVLVGTIAADVIELVKLIDAGELAGCTYSDIPELLKFFITEVEEYRSALASNLGMGLLFAGLGVFALLRKTGKDVSGTKVKKLG